MQPLPRDTPPDEASGRAAAGSSLAASTLDAARRVLKYHADRQVALQRREHPAEEDPVRPGTDTPPGPAQER